MKKILLIVLLILLIGAGLYYYNKQSNIYKNTRFGFQLDIPAEYYISDQTLTFDWNRLIIAVKPDYYDDFSKKYEGYHSSKDFVADNPEFVKELEDDFGELLKDWSYENSESIILVKRTENNNRKLSDLMFVDDVIFISLDDEYLQSEDRESSNGNRKVSVKNITLADGKRGTIVATSFDGDVTNLEVEFELNEKLYNGKNPKSINFSYRGNIITQEELIKLAESLKKF